jgi:hypothetical protein
VKVLPTVALWPVPLVAVIVAGAPAVLVSENDAGDDAPETEAVTEYAPATVFAATLTLARPAELVVAVEVVAVVDAPLAGEVKVTVALGTGLPLVSLTRATS